VRKPHLCLAHKKWEEILTPDDIVIDATCGNGQDLLFLAQILFAKEGIGRIYGIDIQRLAITNSINKLVLNLPKENLNNVRLFWQSHCSFPIQIPHDQVKLIVYNLGYLPGSGKKNFTTLTETTLTSLKNALKLIKVGGLISITCYPGHTEGEREEFFLTQWLSTLPSNLWSCSHHRWINSFKSPSVIFIERKN